MGYIPKAVQRRVRAQARDRCGYCLSSQKYVLGILEIEHIDPEALGGTDDEENLFRSVKVPPDYWRTVGRVENDIADVE